MYHVYAILMAVLCIFRLLCSLFGDKAYGYICTPARPSGQIRLWYNLRFLYWT